MRKQRSATARSLRRPGLLSLTLALALAQSVAAQDAGPWADSRRPVDRVGLVESTRDGRTHDQHAGDASSDVDDVVPDPDATIGLGLLPHEASWRVTIEAPDGGRRDDGIWTDRFELIEHGALRLLRFSQSFIDGSGEQARDNVYLNRYPSLLPVHVELNLPSGQLLTDYFGREVSGSFWRHEEAAAEPFRETLEELAFDFSMSGYLLLDRPWEAGTAIRAPFFAGTIDGSAGVRWIELRIGERDPVQFEGREIDTRVVSVPELGWRMWMVPEPPYVYRSAVPSGTGETTWFDLLRFSRLP